MTHGLRRPFWWSRCSPSVRRNERSQSAAASGPSHAAAHQHPRRRCRGRHLGISRRYVGTVQLVGTAGRRRAGRPTARMDSAPSRSGACALSNLDRLPDTHGWGRRLMEFHDNSPRPASTRTSRAFTASRPTTSSRSRSAAVRTTRPSTIMTAPAGHSLAAAGRLEVYERTATDLFVATPLGLLRSHDQGQSFAQVPMAGSCGFETVQEMGRRSPPPGAVTRAVRYSSGHRMAVTHSPQARYRIWKD